MKGGCCPWCQPQQWRWGWRWPWSSSSWQQPSLGRASWLYKVAERGLLVLATAAMGAVLQVLFAADCVGDQFTDVVLLEPMSHRFGMIFGDYLYILFLLDPLENESTPLLLYYDLLLIYFDFEKSGRDENGQHRRRPSCKGTQTPVAGAVPAVLILPWALGGTRNRRTGEAASPECN